MTASSLRRESFAVRSLPAGARRLSAVGRAALALALACGLAGCSSIDGSSTDGVVAQESATVETDATAAAMDFSYSDRDLDASYDESSATMVVLSDEGVSIDGEGATAQDGSVLIESAGTYMVSGSLSDGSIQVAAGEQDKVQIVFDGVDIHCEDGPAVSISAADKCFITLAEGSSNSLSDGSSYALAEGEDEPNAVVYSKADLTFNGTGSLTIAGSYRHAVCSKDDLVITGGTYDLSATEDALRGKDCVKIADGSFSIEAGEDGIASTNDEDADRGFVSIDGGSFALIAADDGIQAARYARLAGGSFDAQVEDDAVHSDIDALVSGGSFSVVAGDDAFHAEGSMTVQGGTIEVSSCYEGIEGEQVYLWGGDVHIVADDDAVNAASSDASDSGAAVDAAGARGEGPDSGSASVALPDAGSQPAVGGDSASDRAEEVQGGSDSTLEAAPDPSGRPGVDERGGAPQTGMAEGGVGMGDSSCVIEISDGYHVLESGGDVLDSNGSIVITGGVTLAQSAAGTSDYAIDYDIEATIDGGTLIALGGTEMAQNLTSGSQAFAMESIEGAAGTTVSVVDGLGSVLASFTAPSAFETAVVSVAGMQDGEVYGLVIGDSVSGANDDGYASQGVLDTDVVVEVTASCEAQGGFGGLGSDGRPAGAGEPGAMRDPAAARVE